MVKGLYFNVAVGDGRLQIVLLVISNYVLSRYANTAIRLRAFSFTNKFSIAILYYDVFVLEGWAVGVVVSANR